MAGENYVFLISLYMRLFLILMMNELGAYKYRPCFYDLTRLETCDCQLIELFFFFLPHPNCTQLMNIAIPSDDNNFAEHINLIPCREMI